MNEFDLMKHRMEKKLQNDHCFCIQIKKTIEYFWLINNRNINVSATSLHMQIAHSTNIVFKAAGSCSIDNKKKYLTQIESVYDDTRSTTLLDSSPWP